MKKILSWVLALALTLAAGPVAFAGVAAPPPSTGATATPYTVVKTVLGGGEPTSTVAKTINIGDTFDVLFQKSAFQWSTTGSTTYSFEKVLAEWIKISNTDGAFEFVSTVPYPETGLFAIRLKAAKVYSGSLSVHLNSGESATAVWSAKITVEDPKQKAAEQSRLEEQQRQAEQSRIAEEQRQAEQSRLEEQQRQAEQSRLEEQQRQAEQSRIAAEQSQAEQSRIAAEQSQAEQSRIAEEQRQAEQSRIAEERRQAQQSRLEEQQRQAEQSRLEEEKRQAEQSRLEEEKRQAEQSAGTGGSTQNQTTQGQAETTPQADPPDATGQRQPANNPPNIRKLEGTNKDQGTASSSVGGSLLIDEEFDVTFDSDSFRWSTTTGEYSFDGMNTTWISITTSTGASAPVTVVNLTGSTTHGTATVRLRATAAFNGDLSIRLDSDNSSATNAFTRRLEIKLPDNNRTMTGTVRNQGNPTTNLSGNTLYIDDLFDVVFDATALDWTATGDKYSFEGFQRNWIKLTSSTGKVPVVIHQILNNQNTGEVRIRLRAASEFTGSISVALDSTGSSSTAVFTRQVTIANKESRITKTRTGGATPTTTIKNNATVNVGEKMIFTFASDNFEWSGGNKMLGSSMTDASWIKLSGARLTTDFLAAVEPTTDSSVRISLTPVRSGSYRNLTVQLQGGGGPLTTASASLDLTVKAVDSGKITGIRSGARLGGTYSGAYLNGKPVSYNDLGGLEVRGGDELLLPLYAGFFTWSGTDPYEAASVTKTQLSNAKIRVMSTNRSGSRAFTKTEPQLYYNNNTAYVKLEFAKDYSVTRDIDFSMTILLSIDGKRHGESELYLSGTMVRDIYELSDSYSYIDLSDGIVLEATSYLRGVELYLGSGVTAIADLSSGRKYSGVATTEMSSSDETLFRRYSDLDHMYTLKTSGLGSNCKIKLDVGGNYYVYDEKMDYIGMSDETLPFSHKYYLAAKRLSVDDDYYIHEVEKNKDKEPDIPLYATPSGTIDQTATTNSNANPRTGR